MPHALLDKVLSVVVPPLCVACREPELSGAVVCPDCRDALVALAPGCRRCGAPVGAPVERCRECGGRDPAFARAWAPFAYDPAARRIVMALKARSAVRAAQFMATAIQARAPAGLLDGVLVPVPGHPGGRRKRGFDHARLIAAHLGTLTGLPVSHCLRRTPTRPQVGLAHAERQANARGSVALVPGAAPVSGRAVLVDDVYTTGATLDACAQALWSGETGEVTAVCFARTVRRPNDRWRMRHARRSMDVSRHTSGLEEVDR